MNSVASCCSTTPAYRDFDTVSKKYNVVQFSQIEATRKESKDITILTDEGDKVTISYNHQIQLTYANLKALAYNGTFSKTEDQAIVREALARVQGEAFGFEDKQGLTITVEGDLNEHELEDIRKAMESIDEIMTDLLQGGDITEAMAEAAELKDLETITGLEADYRYEKAVLVENTTMQESETYSRPGSAQHIPPGRHGRRLDSFMKFVDRMEKWIEDSRVKPSKFLRPLQGLFRNIHQGLNKDNPIEKAKMRVADLIGSELMKRIRQEKDEEDLESTPKEI